MAQCIQCSSTPVSEEYTRCESCNIAHQELVKKLDSRPINRDKPPKEVLIPIVKKKMVTMPDGERKEIDFVTYYSKEECKIWGLKIPEDYAQT